jgi:hypothetical protein
MGRDLQGLPARSEAQQFHPRRRIEDDARLLTTRPKNFGRGIPGNDHKYLEIFVLRKELRIGARDAVT